MGHNIGRNGCNNSAKLHEKIITYHIFEVDSLSIPVPKSVIGDCDLPYYSDGFATKCCVLELS